MRDRELEMMNGFRNVGGGLVAALRRALIAAAARVVALVSFRERGIDDAEHAIGFTVVRRDPYRLLRRGERLGHAILSEIERGERGRDVGSTRVERHRALVGGDRRVDVVVFVM